MTDDHGGVGSNDVERLLCIEQVARLIMSFSLRTVIRGASVLVFMLAGCSPESTSALDKSYMEKLPEHPNVVVNAPKELVGATLTIDESDRRMLWPDSLIDGRWSFWRKLFGLSQPAPSAAKVYLELPHGTHVLVITRDKYKKIVRKIEVRDGQQQVQVTASELILESSTEQQ